MTWTEAAVEFHSDSSPLMQVWTRPLKHNKDSSCVERSVTAFSSPEELISRRQKQKHCCMFRLITSKPRALSLQHPAGHYAINLNCSEAVATIIICREPKKKHRQRFESSSLCPVKLGMLWRAFSGAGGFEEGLHWWSATIQPASCGQGVSNSSQ